MLSFLYALNFQLRLPPVLRVGETESDERPTQTAYAGTRYGHNYPRDIQHRSELQNPDKQ
jgi:hypothetical protein